MPKARPSKRCAPATKPPWAQAELDFCRELHIPSHVICLMCLGLEAVMFGLFTLIMLWDQMDTALHDSGFLDMRIKEEEVVSCRLANLEYIFGKMSIAWVLPIRPQRVPQRSQAPKDV